MPARVPAMLIAIDGPAGAGKSTVARALAQRLGYTYLDSGAMYRCVALAALQAGGESGVAAQPPGALGVLTSALRIDLQAGDTGGAPSRVLLDGRDVSEEIRAPTVSEAASLVAVDPHVRAALVAKQQQLIATGDWVAEGRDIATVVAPHAELKVFLTASPHERARRRATELGADPGAMLAEQTLRDERDSTLGRSTLTPAPGAVTVDTTGLTLEQVVQRIAALLP
jgi:cytidylate kinase